MTSSFPSAGRLLRSLAWLRWRIVVNTLTRSGARDMLERLSRTAESVLPLAIIVMLVPVGIALAGLGAWTGWTLARSPLEGAWPLQIVRWALLAMFAVTILSPMIISGGQRAAGIVRLMLLPISTRLLYMAHAAAGLADPWVFLSIPLVAGLAGGLMVNHRVGAGLLALAAGCAFLIVLLGVAALASAVLQLLVRDRRRAELVVLVGMLFIVAISILPSVLLSENPNQSQPRRSHSRSRHTVKLPRWVYTSAAVAPSELYVAGVRDSVGGQDARAGTAIAGVLAWGLTLHALTWPIYRRLLQTPATSGGRRRQVGERTGTRVIPGVGPRTSAVAVAFTRLAFRTPRGRSIVLMPVVMIAAFAAMSMVKGTAIPIGPVQVGGGYSLGLFGIVIALMSIGPLVYNQFAVDRAGLTLEFLAPISTRELLYGKALGGALVAAAPCALAIAAAMMTGARSPSVWALVVLGTAASYLITAPVAAVLSLLFPRSVDLSSIGQGSNAHQAAGLLGFLAFAISCAPPVILTIVAWRVLHSSAAAAALLGAWLLLAGLLSFIGFRIAERLLDERRENLALVAQGR